RGGAPRGVAQHARRERQRRGRATGRGRRPRSEPAETSAPAVILDERSNVHPEPETIDDREIPVFPPPVVELDVRESALAAQAVGDDGQQGTNVDPALAPERLLGFPAKQQAPAAREPRTTAPTHGNEPPTP